MARFLKDRSSTKGQSPGSMILIGSQKLENPIIKLIQYNAEEYTETDCDNIKDAYSKIRPGFVTWINIYAIHDIEMMKEIRDVFNLDSLLMEDILNTDQMPKYADGDSYNAFILKMLSLSDNDSIIHSDQLSLILGENYIISFQEKIGTMFNPIRERLRTKKGKIRIWGNDYLLYSLMDTIVDHYLFLIEKLGQRIENSEKSIFQAKDNSIAETIYHHKTELSFLRKNLRPLKEIMHQVLKSDHSFFSDSTSKFIEDLNQEVIQTNESIELYYNLVSDQLNTYNSIMSNKMNQIMKVLTIFASIFIPLTFFAGIYGMNFKNIPELNNHYGYYMFWGAMIVIAAGLLLFFKRKKWL